MSTLEDFDELRNDLFSHVDVLIQHSENYYVLCREAAKREPVDGGRAFNLIRRAVGHEIVSRLYRLIEDSNDATNFPLLMRMLNDDSILQLLMPSFNHDGRQSFADLVGLRDGVLEQFEDVQKSEYFQKVDVYRNRFVAHRVPSPRNLKRYPPSANVTELSSAELRWLTDSLAAIANRINYMSARSGFPAEDIARLAQFEAHALWNLKPPAEPDFLESFFDGDE
tara:strand:- start:1519 stop:2190 length:672 start_codon:yes stop_codon:yes gene_type:complete